MNELPGEIHDARQRGARASGGEGQDGPSNRFAFGTSALARSFFGLMLLLLAGAAIAPASAQDTEKTFGDSYIPLVYPLRDTGAYLRSPEFPAFAQLPIVRPLPDPFRFADGWRDDSFASWERHRAAIMAAIEKYEIGPVRGERLLLCRQDGALRRSVR
jgi:hypothetical protein